MSSWSRCRSGAERAGRALVLGVWTGAPVAPDRPGQEPWRRRPAPPATFPSCAPRSSAPAAGHGHGYEPGRAAEKPRALGREQLGVGLDDGNVSALVQQHVRITGEVAQRAAAGQSSHPADETVCDFSWLQGSGALTLSRPGVAACSGAAGDLWVSVFPISFTAVRFLLREMCCSRVGSVRRRP